MGREKVAPESSFGYAEILSSYKLKNVDFQSRLARDKCDSNIWNLMKYVESLSWAWNITTELMSFCPPPRLWTPLHYRRHQQQVKHYSPYSALDHASKFTIYILFPISILHDLVNFPVFTSLTLFSPSAQHTNRVDKHLIYRVRSSTRLSEHQWKHIKAPKWRYGKTHKNKSWKTLHYAQWIAIKSALSQLSLTK